MPAARLFVALGITGVVLVAAVVVSWMAWLALVLDALVLLAAFVDHRFASLSPLEAKRTLPPLLFQGVAASVEIAIKTPGHRSLTVWLREGLHPAVASRPLRREVLVRPNESSRWRYELVPQRRGQHELGALMARVRGPWGLAWAQRCLLLPERRKVYPRVRWEGKVGHFLALAKRHELGWAPLHLAGSGSEPYALRDYLQGDPPNKIHWKATARHGRLITREDTWEQGAHLLLLLDCARAMSSRASRESELGRGVDKLSKLDYALAASLALTWVAASRGDQVTLLAFSDRIERLVRVRSGARGIRLAYERLFDVSSRLVEPAYDIAVEEALSRATRRSTVVLFTSVVDLAAAELLKEAVLRLERRHRPILVNLEDPELAALAGTSTAGSM